MNINILPYSEVELKKGLHKVFVKSLILFILTCFFIVFYVLFFFFLNNSINDFNSNVNNEGVNNLIWAGMLDIIIIFFSISLLVFYILIILNINEVKKYNVKFLWLGYFPFICSLIFIPLAILHSKLAKINSINQQIDINIDNKFTNTTKERIFTIATINLLINLSWISWFILISISFNNLGYVNIALGMFWINLFINIISYIFLVRLNNQHWKNIINTRKTWDIVIYTINYIPLINIISPFWLIKK